MSDDRSYPSSPVVGAGAVVWRAGEVLLIRRGKNPGYGQWSLPGGAQELGEDIRTTTIREVFEETGCRIGNLRLIDVLDSIARDDNGKVSYHFTLIDFEADWLDGEPRPGPEELDAGFYSLAAIRALDMADWTRAFIEKSAARRA